MLIVGAAILASVNLSTSLAATNKPLLVAGGVQFYIFDVVAIGLTGLGIAFASWRRSFSKLDILLFAVAGLSYLDLVRGLASYSLQAGVEFRGDAVALGAMLFFSQAGGKRSLSEFATIAIILGLSAVIVYFLRRFGLAQLSAFDMRYNMGTFRAQRFVGADDAFAMMLAGLSAVALGMTRRRALFAVPIVLLGLGAIGLSFGALHRSVWVALSVALVAFTVLQYRARLLSQGSVTVTFWAAQLVLVALTAVVLTSPLVQDAIIEASSSDSTLEWRTQGWRGLVQLMGFTDYIIGRGYGSDYSRVVLGQVINNSAHSFYVGKLFQLGAPVEAVYLFLLGSIGLALARATRARDEGMSRRLAVLLLSLWLAAMAYFLAYDTWIPTSFVIGYAISYLRGGVTDARVAARGATRARAFTRGRQF